MREPSLKTEADLSGVVTVEEAREIAQRFIAGHFGNTGKEGPRIRIPADPSHDDDLRLMAFIDQAAAVETERDQLRKALDEKARAGAGVAFDLKELVDERNDLKRKLDEARAREEKHVTIAQDAADRLRRGIETLRDEARAAEDRFEDLHSGRVADRLDAILRGEL
jgi:hypothetical protein